MLQNLMKLQCGGVQVILVVEDVDRWNNYKNNYDWSKFDPKIAEAAARCKDSVLRIRPIEDFYTSNFLNLPLTEHGVHFVQMLITENGDVIRAYKNGRVNCALGTLKDGAGSYRRAWFYGYARKIYMRVHRLVIAAFGVVPADFKERSLEVDHVDGDKSNNSINNLELVTHSENVLRRYRLKKEV